MTKEIIKLIALSVAGLLLGTLMPEHTIRVGLIGVSFLVLMLCAE
jgi:hypothetical protein